MNDQEHTEELMKIQFVDPWESIEESETRTAAENELQKEIGSQHPLSGRDAKAIARRIDCDDVLFLLDPKTTECAVVHLVWHGKRETDPRWPDTELFKTLIDWIITRMLPDHNDYSL